MAVNSTVARSDATSGKDVITGSATARGIIHAGSGSDLEPGGPSDDLLDGGSVHAKDAAGGILVSLQTAGVGTLVVVMLDAMHGLTLGDPISHGSVIA